MQNPRDTQNTHTENKLNGTEAQKLKKSGNFLDSLIKNDKSLSSKKSEVVGGDVFFF